MSKKIVILDYGMGNLRSVEKKIKSLKAEVLISNKQEDLLNAEKIILPGVGHFSKAMENLEKKGLLQTLNKCVLIDKKPILGICLGLQLMAKYSEEGGVKGLGWIDANVVKFDVHDKLNFKIPQMGWNTISIEKNSNLLQNISTKDEFYFVHSFHLVDVDEKIILNKTNYSFDFVSAIEKDNIFGVQFHPEKSHQAGEELIKNFINL
ncbi:MAG: imidazole glycerol phosphate synthase subunit HisH [Chitinophagales bacterium]